MLNLLVLFIMADILVERPQAGPQEMFCATQTTIAIAGGSFFGGKSLSLIMEAGRNIDHPKYRGTIFRRTFPQICDSGGLADIASNVYPQLGGIPTENRTLWSFPSGATVKFNHCQHDSDMLNYRSSQFCFLGIDQLEEFSEEAFFYLRARNRPSPGYNRPAYSRGTCNAQPGWLADFIQWYWNPDTGYAIPERSGAIRYFMRQYGKLVWSDKPFQTVDADGRVLKSISFTFIPSTARDNPKGLENDPNYESNIASMDQVSAERYGKGNWKITYSGGMINPDEIKIISKDKLPKGLRRLRYWDFAATEKKPGNDPARTAGVLVGEHGGDIYVIDVDKFQKDPGYSVDRLVHNAKNDGQDVSIRWEEEKGSAGRFNSHHLTGILIGYDAQPDEVSGEKTERARPLASAAHAGRFYLVEGPWNNAYIAEAGAFPQGKKDQIDATSGAIKCLCTEQRVFDAFTMAKALDYKIDWSQASEYSVLYGAYYQNQRSELYVLSAIWDSLEAKLYLYDAKKYIQIIPERIARDSIKTMRLKAIRDIRLLGNEEFIQKVGNRSTKKVMVEEFKQLNTSWNPVVPHMFELYGSITYGNLLFRSDSLVVHRSCSEASAQIAGWSYREQGKPNEGFEFARCLCLITSDLRVRSKERHSPKPQDYSPVKAAKAEIKETWQVA